MKHRIDPTNPRRTPAGARTPALLAAVATIGLTAACASDRVANDPEPVHRQAAAVTEPAPDPTSTPATDAGGVEEHDAGPASTPESPEAADPTPDSGPEPDPDPDPDPGSDPGVDPNLVDPPVDPEPDPDPDPDPVPGDLVTPTSDPDPDPDPPTGSATLATPTSGTCGAPDQPDMVDAVNTILVDLDRDGSADSVSAYLANGSWWLSTDLATGTTDAVELGSLGVGIASPLGAVQVDFDLVDESTHQRELLVRMGTNAAGFDTAVFGLDDSGCLFRFTGADGAELSIPIHGAITTMSGLMCDDVDSSSFLALLEASTDDGTSYTATSTPLERDGNALLPGDPTSFEIDADEQAGWLSQFGSINCPGITI